MRVYICSYTLYKNVLIEIQLSFAVMAVYFRTNQTSATGGAGSVAVISTFFMLPVGVLIPWMFAVRFFFSQFVFNDKADCFCFFVPGVFFVLLVRVLIPWLSYICMKKVIFCIFINFVVSGV